MLVLGFLSHDTRPVLRAVCEGRLFFLASPPHPVPLAKKPWMSSRVTIVKISKDSKRSLGIYFEGVQFLN
jgi:hypothetical protein